MSELHCWFHVDLYISTACETLKSRVDQRTRIHSIWRP